MSLLEYWNTNLFLKETLGQFVELNLITVVCCRLVFQSAYIITQNINWRQQQRPSLFHNNFQALIQIVISFKYLQHQTWSMGHSGQVGGSLQQGCYPPTSDSSLNSFFLFIMFFLLSILASHHQREKYIHSPCLFWLAAALFLKLLLEAHLQLTVLWPQSWTFAPFESGLSVHRHTEPNLHHTGGVKGITMGLYKKKKGKWNNAETQEQHR